VLKVILVVVVLIFIGFGASLFVWPSWQKENRQIDTWISKNDLNSYGDRQNTAYSNGNPIESSLPADRYEYIKKMHPDHPWTK
jgi:hypothetical protein